MAPHSSQTGSPFSLFLQTKKTCHFSALTALDTHQTDFIEKSAPNAKNQESL